MEVRIGERNGPDRVRMSDESVEAVPTLQFPMGAVNENAGNRQGGKLKHSQG